MKIIYMFQHADKTWQLAESLDQQILGVGSWGSHRPSAAEFKVQVERSCSSNKSWNYANRKLSWQGPGYVIVRLDVAPVTSNKWGPVSP